MTILGIDPGYATVGFGIIFGDRTRHQLLQCGTITTPAGEPFGARLAQIYADTKMLITQFSPDAISIEQLFFHSNEKTAMHVAHARGVLLLACQQSGVPTFEYTPLQVKQAVTGYGRAVKTQVQDMVRRLLHLETVPRPDDAADALAIALCHARSMTSSLTQKKSQT